ncbi:MAG: hypothetical protein GX608_04755 [Lentisphaerae bacterium]|nr:hypothetical protein [Lentisphaerota bacterium]
MNTIRCKALDGSSPLHFLAALGLLRLAEHVVPGATLGWSMAEGVWNPTLGLDEEQDIFIRKVVDWMKLAASVGDANPILRRAVEKCKTDLKKLKEQFKQVRQQVRRETSRRGLRGDEKQRFENEYSKPIAEAIAAKARELESAHLQLAAAYGDGIAHYGEVIGVAPSIVRSRGESAAKAFLATPMGVSPEATAEGFLVSHLPALACDQVTDGGKAVPTRFSFGNGAGGQALLKDWRNLASRVTIEHMQATFVGSDARIIEETTGLNWDPSANRSYALNWDNPETIPKRTDVAANALAYVGLGLLTAMPVEGRLKAIGWGPEDEWTWPLWAPSLRVNVVRSLLAHAVLMRDRIAPGWMAANGIMEVRRSQRIDPSGQGRPYFSPSMVV